MTKTQLDPKTSPARCIFRKSNGSQCRSVAATKSEFCRAHRVPPYSPPVATVVSDQPPVELDLAEELGITSGEFNSHEEILTFLCKLTYLLSANRISSRRAAVLAYITSQAVRTGCVLDKIVQAAEKEAQENVEIVWPDRSVRSQKISQKIETETKTGHSWPDLPVELSIDPTTQS